MKVNKDRRWVAYATLTLAFLGLAVMYFVRVVAVVSEEVTR